MVAINKLAYAAIKNSMKLFDVIQFSCMTNKAHLLNNTLSQIVIFVSIDSNKFEIKKAVEAIFGIEVLKVNTMVIKGKKRLEMRLRPAMHDAAYSLPIYKF
jgi:large subunit ribosomal protein L23